MEAPPVVPPAPPLSSGLGVGVGGPHMSYPDSVDSSPRSRNTDSWDDPLPSVPGAKLRLMCSYGGHIFPRPHDKSLCYVGGDTRIVVADRNSSLADLSARLSKILLQGRSFTLKYQLPNEDLDSLISVTTDEDLENMIDEYDRTSALKPSRLRLFLFPNKPESASSIGSILDNSTKSDDWFLNCLNGTNLMTRGFSDSASVNCLLSLDEDAVANNLDSSSARDLEASQPGGFGTCKTVKQGQDVHSVPDSPMLETSSSFGSTSSSPSLANLPPIRVHVEDGSGGGSVRLQDQKLGIEEQFAQMSVAMQKQDEGFVVLSSPATAGAAVPVMAGGDYPNRVFSDDERSDQGMPVGYRKPPPPQPQQQPLPPQSQQKSVGGIDLASPDSVSRQAQAYSLSMQQSNFSEAATGIPSGRSQAPSAPAMVTSPAAYNPTRNAPLQKPEMAAGMYRTGTAAAPLVQVPSSQHQQQYVGYSQIHHPSQSIAPPSAGTANYAYEFSDPAHAQIFYAQAMAPTLPQYQTMTSAPAVVVPEASAQLSTDNIKQQIRTSQPL
uniref:PB1 domain-containing protein n=1 Tax=Vitis vinifera TaxID=29760 RepID=A5AD05_VITVI|nr:hypothetical protein VITISV_033523 [Vitis vinifera]